MITDDTPFFYKYYKLNSFDPFQPFAVHHTGPVVFMPQLVVFLQAGVLIIFFILLPLYVFKRTDIHRLPRHSRFHFIFYFSCVGIGFMMIEIPMMQKFVLLLGTPIQSITTVLSSLLLSTGLGSFALNRLRQHFQSFRDLLSVATFALVFYLFALIQGSVWVSNVFLPHSAVVRISVVMLMIFPLGFLLGLYFPAGLQIISRDYRDTTAWAWGINSGFSVLGSIVAIMVAQFIGFNAVLLLVVVIYLSALLSFMRLETRLLSWYQYEDKSHP